MSKATGLEIRSGVALETYRKIVAFVFRGMVLKTETKDTSASVHLQFGHFYPNILLVTHETVWVLRNIFSRRFPYCYRCVRTWNKTKNNKNNKTFDFLLKTMFYFNDTVVVYLNATTSKRSSHNAKRVITYVSTNRNGNWRRDNYKGHFCSAKSDS